MAHSNPRPNKAFGRILKSLRQKHPRASQSTLMKKAWAEFKKKSPPKKRKVTARKRKSPAKRKTTRKLSPYARFLKQVGGRGYSRTEIARMWARKQRGVKPWTQLKPKVSAKKKAAPKRRRASGRRISARKPTGFAALVASEKRLAKNLADKKRRESQQKSKVLAALRRKGHSPTTALAIWRSGSANVQRALANGIALDNPKLGDLISPMWWFDSLKDNMVPAVSGLGVAAAAHGALLGMGYTPMIIDKLESLPVVGAAFSTPIPVIDRSLAEFAPYTIQGTAAFAGLAVLAAAAQAAGFKRASVFLGSAGASAAALGPVIDLVFASADATQRFSGDELAGLALDNFGALALDNESALGGLALDNVSALGGLALDNFGDLGDGFAYQTAPLQAAQNVGGYEQSAMGDAYYSGADFSAEEGECLLNGRDTWYGSFGAPSYRPKSDPTSASHLAGQPGHRWGWLIQCYGWDKAREIAALPPRKRLKVIKSLRQSALAAFQKEMLTASSPAEASVSELAPAAPTGPVGAYGDPALFMA